MALCYAPFAVRRGTRISPSPGYPKTIRGNQGSEFVSQDLDLWAYLKGVVLDFSRPFPRACWSRRDKRGAFKPRLQGPGLGLIDQSKSLSCGER
jgi:hypothetical protein